jgi:hypothetical protein
MYYSWVGDVMLVSDYLAYVFKIGENIEAMWIHTGVLGEFYYPQLVGIKGTGKMYDTVEEYIHTHVGFWSMHAETLISEGLSFKDAVSMAMEDPDLFLDFVECNNELTWDDIVGSTLNFYLKPGIGQYVTIPEGITSISERFMSGFVLYSLSIPEGVTTIGDYAFCGAGSYTINREFRNYFYSLELPSTLEHIGKKAFGNCINLETITIKNPNYEIEDYGSSEDIFYLPLNTGSNCDSDGYQKTNLVCYNTVIVGYDWVSNFHRILNTGAIAYYHCYDSVNGDQSFRVYEKPQGQYNRAIFIESLNKTGYIAMTDIDDTSNGGNRVQFVNDKSYRYKY